MAGIADFDDQWPAFAAALKAWSRAVAAADKAAKVVKRPGDDPPAARAAIDAVRAARAAIEAPALAPDALERLERGVEERAVPWRLERLGAIQKAVEAAGLRYARITAREVRIGPMSVSVDFEKGEARVAYARETLSVERADPDVIVEAIKEHHKALRRGDPEPRVIFEDLHTAYRTCLARRGGGDGDRVPLVALLPELFVVRQSDSFWNKPGPKSFTSVTRAQLAFDLDRLQRARALQMNGRRVVLGSATGGSAAKKREVLFLEAGPAGGQFYLSFAMQRVGADR